MDFYWHYVSRDSCTALFAYLNLLGVYFLLLGIALAGLIAARRKRTLNDLDRKGSRTDLKRNSLT